MPKERTLFEKLFDKSGDELKRLEADPAPPVTAPVPEEMSEEDKKIMERIRKFREEEGRNPDTGKTALLEGEKGEFDDFIANDPAFAPLQPDTPADPIEEEQMRQVVSNATSFIFGDKMSSVIRSLKSNPDLFESVAETGFQILKKEATTLANKGDGVEPAVFIAQTGATPIVIDALWDLARQLKLEGAEDRNQYAAAMINVYKKMGESVIESGDDQAITEAEELATQIALADDSGIPREALPEETIAIQENQLEQRPVARGINEALLGGQV